MHPGRLHGSYRLFGFGGLGLGVLLARQYTAAVGGRGAVAYPVVSYAPRPMFMTAKSSLTIICTEAGGSQQEPANGARFIQRRRPECCRTRGPGLTHSRKGSEGLAGGYVFTSDKRRITGRGACRLSQRLRRGTGLYQRRALECICSVCAGGGLGGLEGVRR